MKAHSYWEIVIRRFQRIDTLMEWDFKRSCNRDPRICNLSLEQSNFELGKFASPTRNERGE